MKKECLECGSTENLELAHMLSADLTRAIIARQFKSKVSRKEIEVILAHVRKSKGDVWLCHEHHMYSNKRQREMASLINTNLKIERKEADESLTIKAGTLNLDDKEEPDTVNHPPHYKTGGIETIDFIEAKELDYNRGNVIKYVTRAKHKGNELEDLKKGLWYLNRAIEKLGSD